MNQQTLTDPTRSTRAFGGIFFFGFDGNVCEYSFGDLIETPRRSPFSVAGSSASEHLTRGRGR